MEYSKLYAERIGGEKFGTDTTVYKFEKIKRARKKFEAAHPEISVINVGVGEHDGLEPKSVSNMIAEEVFLRINKGIQSAFVENTDKNGVYRYSIFYRTFNISY